MGPRHRHTAAYRISELAGPARLMLDVSMDTSVTRVVAVLQRRLLIHAVGFTIAGAAVYHGVRRPLCVKSPTPTLAPRTIPSSVRRAPSFGWRRSCWRDRLGGDALAGGAGARSFSAVPRRSA